MMCSGHRRLVTLGQKGWPRSKIPDVGAQVMAGVAAISDPPSSVYLAGVNERYVVRLPRRQLRGDRSFGTVSDPEPPQIETTRSSRERSELGRFQALA